MGTVGDALDNAVVEAFWARMQVELLNRTKRRTRVELANAMFEYLEIEARPPKWGKTNVSARPGQPQPQLAGCGVRGLTSFHPWPNV